MEAAQALVRRVWKPAKNRETASCKVNYTTLFWLFLFGSVGGFVLEGLWCVFTKGHWEHHAATVWGPFCIIYGVGAVAVYLLAILLRNKNILLQFAAFTVSGAAVEFFGSLVQELCVGSVSWNYSAHMLNLGGRVSFKMALLWGVLGILFIRLALPLVRRLLAKIQGRGWQIASIAMTAFMVVNLLVTAAAITRWRARETAPVAANAAVQWLDETYDDTTMERLFPNMQFVAD